MPIFEGYGLTETAALRQLQPSTPVRARIDRNSGRLVEMKIVDPEPVKIARRARRARSRFAAPT